MLHIVYKRPKHGDQSLGASNYCDWETCTNTNSVENEKDTLLKKFTEAYELKVTVVVIKKKLRYTDTEEAITNITEVMRKLGWTRVSINLTNKVETYTTEVANTYNGQQLYTHQVYETAFGTHTSREKSYSTVSRSSFTEFVEIKFARKVVDPLTEEKQYKLNDIYEKMSAIQKEETKQYKNIPYVKETLETLIIPVICVIVGASLFFNNAASIVWIPGLIALCGLVSFICTLITRVTRLKRQKKIIKDNETKLEELYNKYQDILNS